MFLWVNCFKIYCFKKRNESVKKERLIIERKIVSIEQNYTFTMPSIYSRNNKCLQNRHFSLVHCTFYEKYNAISGRTLEKVVFLAECSVKEGGVRGPLS